MPDLPSTPPDPPPPPLEQRRNPINRQARNPPSTTSGGQQHTRHPQNASRQPHELIGSTEASQPRRSRGRGRGGSTRGRPNTNQATESSGVSDNSGGDPARASQPRSNQRRKNFGSQLTSVDGGGRSNAAGPPGTQGSASDAQQRSTVAAHANLTSRLTSAFSRSAAPEEVPDCPICFNAIGPGQPTWSCSPTAPSPETAGDVAVTCWTTIHLKCIRAWAAKSTKETREAYQARNIDNQGEWRCPGCQTKRFTVPTDYKCFCGRVTDPKPGRLSTPHSCGNGCSRPRGSCVHPCPLSCHPGPCPPCLLTITQHCHCGRQTLSLRCSTLTSSTSALSVLEPLSCNQPCGRTLDCGIHVCEKPCHPSACGACERRVEANCYCSAETRDMRCGDGNIVICEVQDNGIVGGTKKWEGRFKCDNTCNRPFDCDVHRCQKGCHPPSVKPPQCPRSPSLVTTCPCSHQTPLFSLASPPRKKCTDAIPTCGKRCSLPHEGCGHECERSCHEGSCGKCQVMVEEKCRCGRIGRKRVCWQVQVSLRDPTAASALRPGSEDEDDAVFKCGKKCLVKRNCGRHVCGRICCPLAALSGLEKGKKKQKDVAPTAEELKELDPDGWHICDLICNKPLSCGNHACAENDHRGPCPPCLQSSYDELICHCRRTIMEPPIPCGTVIRCQYPCSRPRPACGHPRTPHTCHEDDGGCPPCPYLTEKTCACGKMIVKNVRCSQEKVSCGLPCGKLLDCGFHACDKICHTGDCGTCSQVCGKSRKFCLPYNHPCTVPCHAPAGCPEADPCPAMITLKCVCGRLSQPALCAASSTNPASAKVKSRQLPCSQECEVAKRNERLAAALGISPDRAASGTGSGGTAYSESLQTFWRANAPFAAGVEKHLADFVGSDKRMALLPPMPPLRRKFVRELAEVYRVDTTEVDQDPRRSVQLIRRIDTRIPSPLLSATVSANTSSRPSGLSQLKKPSSGLVFAPSAPIALPVKMAWGAKSTAVANTSSGMGGPSAATHVTAASGLTPKTTVSTAPSSSAAASRPRSPASTTPVVTRSIPAAAAAQSPQATPQENIPDEWDQDDI